MIRPAASIEKRESEKFPIGFRYRDPDLETGVTISSVSASCSPSGLTLGSAQYEDDSVWVWIEGGTSGTDYTVTFTTTFSDDKILIDDYVVRVR